MNRKRPHYRKVRSIEQLDYEKLALAIVKAQEMAGAQVAEGTQPKVGLLKTIWLIIIGKQKTDGKMTAELFSTILSVLLTVIALVVSWGLIEFFVHTCIYINMLGVHIILKLVLWLISFGACVGFLFLTLLMRGAAIEMEKETDKYYILAVFTALNSMVTLIITLF